jgi:hypothetical protein
MNPQLTSRNGKREVWRSDSPSHESKLTTACVFNSWVPVLGMRTDSPLTFVRSSVLLCLL